MRLESIEKTPLILSSRYCQPALLCGPSCIVAAIDWRTGRFAKTLDEFQIRVANLVQKVRTPSSDSHPNPPNISSLETIAKLVGLRTKIVKLSEIDTHILDNEPLFVVMKIRWESNQDIYTTRELNSAPIRAEYEHYILVYNRKGETSSCWEPSFSGKDQSPLLNVNWDVLIRGNANLYSSRDKNLCLLIY